jgi:hypothetical protein
MLACQLDGGKLPIREYILHDLLICQRVHLFWCCSNVLQVQGGASAGLIG